MIYNLFLLLSLTILISLFPPTTYAQETKGITVTPSILRLDLATASPEAELIYKNNSTTEVVLDFSATDFTELEDGWRVKFLNEAESKNYHYSLSSWIEFEKKSLSLKPNEEGRMKVLINKDELSPGGHYGSVLANISSLDQNRQPLTIKGSLSTLLFVRANTGKEEEHAQITEVIPERSSIFSFPKNFILRFNNQGNTELIPYGRLTVTDLLGHTVAEGILNEGSNISLPGSLKRYQIKTNSLTPFSLPGIYHLSLQLKYGKTEQQLTYNQSFIAIDSKLLFSVAAFIIMIIFISHKIRHRIKST